jgi:hypothetical protein
MIEKNAVNQVVRAEEHYEHGERDYRVGKGENAEDNGENAAHQQHPPVAR